MKRFQCEICGGTSIIQIDERTYECQDCGLQYDISEIGKLEQTSVAEETTILKPSPKIDFDDLYTKLEQRTDESDEVYFENERPVDSEIEDNKFDSDEVPESKISANAMATINALLENNSEEIDTEEINSSTKDAIESCGKANSVEEPIIYEADENSEEKNDTASTKSEEISGEGIEEKHISLPWYRNKKIATPLVSGLLVIIVTLSIIMLTLPEKPTQTPHTDDANSQNLVSSEKEFSNVNTSSENSDSEKDVPSKESNSSITSQKNNSESKQTQPTQQKGFTGEKETSPDIEGRYGTNEYVNGELVKRTVYDKNGNLWCIEMYKNGDENKITYFYENGKTYQIYERLEGDEFKNTFYYESGQISRIEYCVDKNGMGVGIKTTDYHENGVIAGVIEYENGEIKKWSQYNETGNISHISEYKNGEQTSSSHYENGKISRKEEYENGKFKKIIQYYDNGNISSVNEYKDGELIKSTDYNENGKIQSLTEYENGETKKWTSYDENGNVTDVVTY